MLRAVNNRPYGQVHHGARQKGLSRGEFLHKETAIVKIHQTEKVEKRPISRFLLMSTGMHIHNVCAPVEKCCG